MPTPPDPPNAPAGSGLTEAEARTRLDALGERGELPTSRSYKSIVRANTLTLFNLILGSFLVLILIAGRPADGLFAGVMVANTAIGIVQEVRASAPSTGWRSSSRRTPGSSATGPPGRSAPTTSSRAIWSSSSPATRSWRTAPSRGRWA